MSLDLPWNDVRWIVDSCWKVVSKNPVLEPRSVHLEEQGGETCNQDLSIVQVIAGCIKTVCILTFTIWPRPGLRSGSGCSSPDLIPVQFITTSAPDSASCSQGREIREKQTSTSSSLLSLSGNATFWMSRCYRLRIKAFLKLKITIYYKAHTEQAVVSLNNLH